MGRFSLAALLICSARTFVSADNDTPLSADLKGAGAFLRGAGSFNLNTAKAWSLVVTTWKRELRKDAARWRMLHDQREAGKTLKAEEARRRWELRQYQIRVDPTPSDVESGRALNAILNDLMAPNISTSDWVTKAVPLPEGTSVKDLVFSFVPATVSSNASKALSRGVIALSRLDTTGEKWPLVMRDASLGEERQAYEAAYAKLRQGLLTDKFDMNMLNQLDQSLDALDKKVKVSIQKERGYGDAATKIVKDLRDATTIFDAATVDYAKEILLDTQNGDATNVSELVSFMLKYRLQFASAEHSPNGRVLYGRVYEALRQQAEDLDIEPPDAPNAQPANQAASPFQPHSIWASDKITLTVTERNGDNFKAIFTATGIHRIVTGTVRGNEVSWLAANTVATKGGKGCDNFGKLVKDKGVYQINVAFRNCTNKTRPNNYTLYQKTNK
ncbi:MAG TPA: hypothetical protein VHC22_24175 [Pirellulales bacterium]|nr:hypothetical protein [Pirellulales bacterium]